MAHEPPLVDLLKGQPEFQPMLDSFQQRVESVVELLWAGEMEAAAAPIRGHDRLRTRRLGDAAPAVRETFIRNAPTFLDEANDPEGLTIDLGSLRAFDKPALVTMGTTSPPFFKPIAGLVAQALPRSTAHVFEGAGHVPHLSHPQQYVQTVKQFCYSAASSRS